MVLLAITIPSTCSVVVVIWTVAMEDIAVAGVPLKLVLLPGGGIVSM